MSPYLKSVVTEALRHNSGTFAVSKHELHIARSMSNAAALDIKAFQNSAGILSLPHAFPFFILATTLRSSASQKGTSFMRPPERIHYTAVQYLQTLLTIESFLSILQGSLRASRSSPNPQRGYAAYLAFLVVSSSVCESAPSRHFSGFHQATSFCRLLLIIVFACSAFVAILSGS